VSAESEIDVNISKTSQFLVRYADAETPDHPDHDVKLINRLIGSVDPIGNILSMM